MPLKCCIPGCKSNYYTTVRHEGRFSVFKFPQDKILRDLWLRKIPRTNWLPGRYSAVCIKHFKKSDVISHVTVTCPDGTLQRVPLRCAQLETDAVPCNFDCYSINLSKQDTVPQKSTDTTQDTAPKSKMGRRCCVPGCKSNYESQLHISGIKSTFSFPNDEVLKRKWVEAIKRKDWSPTRASFVCSVHFSPNQIIRVKRNKLNGVLFEVPIKQPYLVATAVPHIFPDTSISSKKPSTHTRPIKEITSTSQFVIKSSVESKPEQPSEKDPLLIDTEITNEFSKDVCKIEIDERVLQIENSLKTILTELGIITLNDLNADRSQKLKSDVLAIIFCYLSDVETFFDYEEKEGPKRVIVKEEILDIDEVDYSRQHEPVTIIKRPMLPSDYSLEGDYDNNLEGDNYDNNSQGDNYDNSLEGDNYDNNLEGDNYDNSLEGDNYDNNLEGDNYDNSLEGDDNDNNLEGDKCETVVGSCSNGHDLDREESTNDKTVEFIYEMHNYFSKDEPHVGNINITNTGERVLRHTCFDCDLSLSSGYLLSKHSPLCIARYSNDNILSYWGRRECPKCYVKFKTRAHLKQHLLSHKIQEYERLLKSGSYHKDSQNSEVAIAVSTDDVNSDNGTNKETLSQSEEDELIKNGIDKYIFKNIFVSSEPDSEFHVTFAVNNVIPSTPDINDNVCEFCDDEFSSLNELIEHKRSTHPGRGHPYVCNHCPLMFQRFFTLSDHMRKIHTNVTTADGRNKYLKRGAKEFSQHYPTSIYFSAVECAHCRRMFISAKDLKTHQERQNMIKKYCTSENLAHQSVDSKMSETNDNDTGKMTKCPLCPKILKSQSLVIHHIRNVHKQSHVCEKCGAVHNSLKSLQYHLLVHSNIKNFKCSLCHKTFTDERSLKEHHKIHEKQLICQFCGKRFLNNCSLKVHVNVHLGIKPFKCSSCQRAYATKRLFQRHMGRTKCRFKKSIQGKD